MTSSLAKRLESTLPSLPGLPRLWPHPSAVVLVSVTPLLLFLVTVLCCLYSWGGLLCSPNSVILHIAPTPSRNILDELGPEIQSGWASQ